MPNGDDPKTSAYDPLPITRVPTLKDLDRLHQRRREGALTYAMLGLKPYEESFIPRDTSEQQALIQELAGSQADAYRQAVEQSQQNAARARLQTALNLFGPTAFQALTGADIDTRLGEQLRLERQAEERARELEQEAGLRIPTIEGQAELEAQQLEDKTAYQNLTRQEAVEARNAERQREALATGVEAYNTVVGNEIERRSEVADRLAEARQNQTDARMEALRIIARNPNMAHVLRADLGLTEEEADRLATRMSSEEDSGDLREKLDRLRILKNRRQQNKQLAKSLRKGGVKPFNAYDPDSRTLRQAMQDAYEARIEIQRLQDEINNQLGKGAVGRLLDKGEDGPNRFLNIPASVEPPPSPQAVRDSLADAIEAKDPAAIRRWTDAALQAGAISKDDARLYLYNADQLAAQQ